MNPVFRMIAWAATFAGAPDMREPEVYFYIESRRSFEEVNRRIDLEWEKVLRQYPQLPPPPARPMKP